MRLRHYLAISGGALLAISPVVLAMADPVPAFAIFFIGLVLVAMAVILTPADPEYVRYCGPSTAADKEALRKDLHPVGRDMRKVVGEIEDPKHWPPRGKK